MKQRKFFTGLITVALVAAGGSAYGQLKPKISSVEMQKCNNQMVLYQGEEFQNCWVYGPGISTALGVQVSPSGVSGVITERYPLAKPGSPPQDKLRLKLTATGSAAIDKRVVTINGPGWSGNFTIYVKPKARITGHVAPEPEISFQNNVDVLLNGEHLGNIHSVSAVLESPIHNESGNQISTTSVWASASVNTSTTPHTENQVMIRLNFSQKLTEANVRIQLFGDGTKCGALRAHADQPLTRTVNIKAKPSQYNYVKSITFPYGGNINVGSVATIQINLEKPVPQSTGLYFISTDGTASSAGAHVLWKLIPADAFEQASGGSAYNPNSLNTLIIPGGNEFGQITVKVKKCPGSSTSSTVKIQTWRLNKNTFQPPWFKEQQFTITCPQ